MYIYIYIYICTYTHIYVVASSQSTGARRCRVASKKLGRRPAPDLPIKISPLLRFVDSDFPGKFPMAMITPPLKVKILPESNPPKSKVLVGRLAVLSFLDLASVPCEHIQS